MAPVLASDTSSLIDPASIEAGRALYVIGDVRDCLATTPDGSIDLVMTSPPFLALRSYLPADHPDKHREIGSEPDPATFIDTLLSLTAEFRRVLAPHGSIVVELGDTYSGSGGAGGDYNADGLREGQNGFRASGSGEWPLPKSMVGIPHLYHLSLAYGRNLLTGEPSPAGQWRVRNVVAWCRPNPPVGALGDKFRPATSYLTIATIAGDRFFDLDAVRTPLAEPHAVVKRNERKAAAMSDRDSRRHTLGQYVAGMTAGAPPLDWWEIPTQPYSGAHYAVYPPALLDRPIKSMTPRKVCTTCGEPSRRIAETTNAVGKAVGRAAWRDGTDGIGAGHSGDLTITANDPSVPEVAERRTIGWTDCGHDNWRPGVVLDPFAGSGTTLAVATGLGHAALGYDLDARNANLALDRIGPLLTDTRHLSETP